MTTAIVSGLLLSVFGLVLWMLVRSAYRRGMAWERERQYRATLDAARRIADATTNSPRDPGELAERMRNGGAL